MASGNLRPFSSYLGPSGLLLPFETYDYYLPINLEDAEEEEIEWRGFRGKPIRDSEGNVEDLVVDFHHLVERSGEMAKQLLKDHDCKDFTELSKKFPPVDGEPVVQIKPFDASPWFPKKEEKKLPKQRKASKGKSKTTGTAGVAKVQNAKVQNAKVQNAKVQNAKVQNAKVQNAKVQNAKVQNAKVQNAKVQNAKVQNAKVQNAKKKKKVGQQEELNAMLAAACEREGGLQAFNSVEDMVEELERLDPTFALQYEVSIIDLDIM